jgi:hypothetical protein
VGSFASTLFIVSSTLSRNDPWRALLLNLTCLLNSTNCDCERTSKRKKIGTEEQNVSQSCIDWKGIIEATKAAVRNRLRMSLDRKHYSWDIKGILEQALEILDLTSQELHVLV